jgi:hypothetical protein
VNGSQSLVACSIEQAQSGIPQAWTTTGQQFGQFFPAQIIQLWRA